MGVMQPENPLVGGTVLRRAAIRSPNFVSGSAGWTINQDGSAEFNNLIIRNGQIVSGTALFYSGAPALGNLIASIAAAAGADSFLNAYLAGIASYGPGVASQLNNGIVTFYSGPVTQKGPWTALGTIADTTWTEPAASQIVLTIAGGPALFALTAALLTLVVPMQISTQAAAGKVLSVQDQTSNPANPIVQITANANTPDFSLGILVAGDNNQRFRVDSDGSVHWGTGAVATDTVLSRNGAGNLLLGANGVFTAGVLKAIVGASGNQALDIHVTGDTNPRLQVLGSGNVQWGTGAAAVDTTLGRLGVAVAGVPAAGGLGFTGGAAPAAIASVPLLYGSSASRVRELSPAGHDTVVSGTQTNVTSTTVTAAAFTALTNLFNIPANELAGFSVVEVETEGIATWGSTQQTLLFGADRDSALYGNSSTILATAFAASTALNWEAKVRLRVLTAGAGGTASVMVAVTLSPTTGSRTVGDAVRLVRRTPSTAFDTTVSHTIGLGCQWGSTTGAPTITSDGSTYRRDGS